MTDEYSSLSTSDEYFSLPTSPEMLLSSLTTLGIITTTYCHSPVFTVADSHNVCQHLPGRHCKSLFLKDKKHTQFWLLMMCAERRLDLHHLSIRLGTKRLSFASADQLWRILGVRPGSVSPFALINDTAHLVTVLLDRDMMSHSLLNYHPLVNDRTTVIRSDDLLKFLTVYGYVPLVIDLDAHSAITKTIE